MTVCIKIGQAIVENQNDQAQMPIEKSQCQNLNAK
jgi:hypothetical protein